MEVVGLLMALAAAGMVLGIFACLSDGEPGAAGGCAFGAVFFYFIGIGLTHWAATKVDPTASGPVATQARVESSPTDPALADAKAKLERVRQQLRDDLEPGIRRLSSDREEVKKKLLRRASGGAKTSRTTTGHRIWPRSSPRWSACSR